MKINTSWNNVMFIPWIGTNYSNGGIFKKKILILGESHYCEDVLTCEACCSGAKNSCNEFTCKIIKGQITESEKKHAFFTKLAKLCIGKSDGVLSLQEKNDFWESVAFYNYIQSSVPAPRIPPTPQMWLDAEKPFYQVMETLAPDFLLILGCRLWENLPGQAVRDWPAGQKISCNSITEPTWYYKGKKKNTLSLNIYHPSSFKFSYDYTPIVKEALALS